MRILISPFAAKLPNGRRNAKEFPHWERVIELLNAEGHEVIQIGVTGETRLPGVAQFIQDWPLNKLADVVRSCDRWISCDSFLPHFCATERLQPGIVIWSQSSPRIWGYPTNVNLLKSVQYLRPFQYAPWFDVEYNEDAFVSPEVVVDAVHGKLALAASA